MTRNTVFLFCLFVFLSQNLSAQNIELNETVAIKEMTNAWVANQKSGKVMEGWRVQVASSTDRFEAQAVKDRFAALYPQWPCDWYHEKPYYKVKVGAFRHSWEARRLMALVRPEFSVAYPVFDKKIKPSDFIPITTQ
jgi:SPOR domain